MTQNEAIRWLSYACEALHRMKRLPDAHTHRTNIGTLADDLQELFQERLYSSTNTTYTREALKELADYYLPTGRRGRIQLSLHHSRLYMRVRIFMRAILLSIEP